MNLKTTSGTGRRVIARLSLALGACLVLFLWSAQVTGRSVALAQATATATPLLLATPVCSAPASLTPSLTEGPFYKAGSPERTSLLEAGVTGTPIRLTGFVLSADCKPVAGAWLDFWQADGAGNYDNTGYHLRGHQLTDAAGRYTLDTVFPGLYTGRTEHIHVKVQAPGKAVLTTQIFFPGEPSNDSDSIFMPEMVVSVLDPVTGAIGTRAAVATQAPTADASGKVSVSVYTINFVIETK